MSVQFQSKVYKKKAEADYVSKGIFLKQVADADVLRTGPKLFTDSALSALEYFGLLMPVAKITVPCDISRVHDMYYPGDNITSPQSWAVWSQNGKKWMFSVSVPIKDAVLQYRQSVSGKILFREDVDYWRAFRGLHPARKERFEEENSEEWRKYIKNPFDMPLFMIRHANENLDGLVVVPMYKVGDVHMCLNLLAFLDRFLPIEYSILAFAESQKRTKKHIKRKKGKIYDSLNLIETLWQSIIRRFDSDLKRIGPSFPHPPVLSITPYFYRNHYITCYIHQRKREGLSIYSACAQVADKLSRANPRGRNMSIQTVRTTVYYATIKNFHIPK